MASIKNWLLTRDAARYENRGEGAICNVGAKNLRGREVFLRVRRTPPSFPHLTSLPYLILCGTVVISLNFLILD